MRILVVDDYADLLKAVKIMLASEGHRVTTAADGREGLRKFDDAMGEIPFDAVISDWNMPFVNGFEMVTEMLQRDPTVKIVMMSGNYTNEPPLRADGRIIKMFQKPFHPTAMLEELVKP